MKKYTLTATIEAEESKMKKKQPSNVRLMSSNTTNVDNTLAVIIGLTASIILTRIHRWLNADCTKNNIFEGRRWVWNTFSTTRPPLDELKGKYITSWVDKENFPYWNERTIRRGFKTLKDLGLIVTRKHGGADVRTMHTTMVAIDYEAYEQLMDEYVECGCQYGKHICKTIAPEGSESAHVEDKMSGTSRQEGSVEDKMSGTVADKMSSTLTEEDVTGRTEEKTKTKTKAATAAPCAAPPGGALTSGPDT